MIDPADAAGARRGAARRRRGDGGGARPLGPLRQHQGAARLLDRRSSTRDGRMIAQAEHMPVHLGAMPDAVAAVRELRPRPGAVYVLNDPYTGGTHLPDITLVSVVDDLGLVCSRAHHADVGGMQPASMPAGATELIQEGVVIPPVELTDDVRRLLVANMRKPAERLADLRAQQACMLVGAARLRELARPARPPRCWPRGWTSSTATASGARAPRSAGCPTAATGAGGRHRGRRHPTRRHPDPGRGRDPGDGGHRRLRRHRARSSRATSTARSRSPARPSTTSCGRCAIPTSPRRAAPLRPVTVRAPAGCLVNARPPAAVVAGNTETSSRIVDVVMSALGTGGRRARPRPGDDEQRHVRHARVHVLRDARRRPGRLAGRPGAERRPRGDVEHPEHADRGARAGVSAADRALRAAPAHGRRGRASAAATASCASTACSPTAASGS